MDRNYSCKREPSPKEKIANNTTWLQVLQGSANGLVTNNKYMQLGLNDA
jgi:hypothetical protein